MLNRTKHSLIVKHWCVVTPTTFHKRSSTQPAGRMKRIIIVKAERRKVELILTPMPIKYTYTALYQGHFTNMRVEPFRF